MRIALAIAIGFLGACTFGRLDGLTGGASEVADAGDGGGFTPNPPGDLDAASTGQPDAATDAEGGTPRVTLLTESFEGDRAGSCQGTGFNSAYLPQRTRAHTGSAACMICSMGTDQTTYSYFTPVVGAVVQPGTRYHGTIWLRAQQAGFGPVDMSFALRTTLRSTSETVEIALGYTQLTAEWRALDVDLPVTKTADLLDIFVAQSSGTGFCFVIDDLEVTRLQ